MPRLRLAANIVVGFMFSLTVLFTFLITSLFGVQARDTVELVVTEATGMQREMVILSIDLQPLVFHNIFYLCLAGFGFMLIFLYYIDSGFRGFFSPGVLAISITAFLSLALMLSRDQFMRFAGPGTDLYMQNAVERFTASAISMSLFGLVLILFAVYGDAVRNRLGLKR